MAWSTCPKCDNHSFEMVEIDVRNSQFKLMSIQCASCGAVVGIMDYYNIGAKIEEVLAKLKRLS